MVKLFLNWLSGTGIWGFVLLRIVPFLRFSTYYTRFSGEKYLEGYKVLSPGQFVLTLDEQKLTSRLVPGFTSHAGFVVGNRQYSGKEEYEIGEMTHKNYTRSYFFDVCKESSRVLICDCLDWDLAHKQRMIGFTPRFFGAAYDVAFTFGLTLLYCSELVYQLDRMASHPDLNESRFTTSKLEGKMKVDLSDFAGLGREYISPDGLLFGKNTIVVWDSDGELTGLTGEQAEEYCRKIGYIT